MKTAKIFKFFKKGARAASDSKGKGADGSSKWPPGIRIGLFGHYNTGKTVYLTVLNEECKISKDLQISVIDDATSRELLSHHRSIWGFSSISEIGTVVDMVGEKEFPKPTNKDIVCQFNAILDSDKKVSVVTYDYPGKSVSIDSGAESKEKVLDFMSGCDGILFFFDPKVLGSDIETQARVASFVSMLEKLAPHHKKLPIPVALVITKSDTLPGFSSDDQTVLINAEDEHLLSEDFNLFLNKILTDNKITSNPEWSGSVRKTLIKLNDFLKVVVGRTLNFQIFFTSSTGQTPEKIGTDVGRSLYKPPEKITPIGVKTPFYWLLKSIIQNRNIRRVKSVTKTIAIISFIWIVLFSTPFLIHFKYLLPKAQNIENQIVEANSGNVFSISDVERKKIKNAYRHYENSRWTKWFFESFQTPAAKIRNFYHEFDITESVIKLDKYIMQLNAIINDSTLWPKLNPGSDSIEVSSEIEKIISFIEEFHTGDETSILFARSDRVIKYWEFFISFIGTRADSVSVRLSEQVNFNQVTYGKELSSAEKTIGQTFIDKLSAQKQVQIKKVVSQKASVGLDDVIAEINGNNSPSYRLDKAVTKLRKLKNELDSAKDPDGIKMIERYIQDARKWTKKQTFTYKIESIPDNGHLHIEITPRGEDPTWSDENQIFEGDEYKIDWKMNDDIHIAIDEMTHECNWGKNPSDKIVIKGKFSIFEMEGTVRFENLGKQISISFKKDLSERLPKLKK